MKVVKYEVEVKLEGKEKESVMKRKYRHMSSVRKFIRSLVGGECKWTEEGNVIKVECTSSQGRYLINVSKVRLQKLKKEEKQEGKPEEKGKS